MVQKTWRKRFISLYMHSVTGPQIYFEKFFLIKKSQSRCCLTFSSLELQLLLSCFLIHVNICWLIHVSIIILRHLYLLYLCPWLEIGLFSPMARTKPIYIVSIWYIFFIILSFIMINGMFWGLQTHLLFCLFLGGVPTFICHFFCQSICPFVCLSVHGTPYFNNHNHLIIIFGA